MIQQKLKSTLPHVIAVLIFIVLAAIYFYPKLQGLSYKQGDIVNFAGAAKEIGDFREKYDSEPLWTNSMFGGMPAYQISTRNTNYVNTFQNYLIFKPLSTPIAFLFLSMLGFYIFLLCFGVNPWLSIIGAVAFGFSSLNLLYLDGGHNTKVQAIALIPPIIGGLVLAYRKNLIMGAALVALFICLELAANHLQMTYYALFLLIPVVLVELFLHIREKLLVKFLKVSGVVLIAVILGSLPALTNLYTTYEYSKSTTRGLSELTIKAPNTTPTTGENALAPGYIKEYNFGAGEIWSLAIPEVKGGVGYPIYYRKDGKKIIENVKTEYRQTIAEQSSYWGEQSATGGAFYFGASMFVLFILGFVFVKNPIKWAFLAASLLAIVLSLKYSPILDFFILHFPLFNKFRDTKMFLYLVQIAFPVMGVLFIKELFDTKMDTKKLLYALISINALFVVFYIAPRLWFDFISSAESVQFNEQMEQIKSNPAYVEQFQTVIYELENARIAIFRADVFRSLVFAVLMSALIFAYVKGLLKKNYLIIAAGLLVLIDIWAVDKRYVKNETQGNYRNWVRKSESAVPIKATESDIFIYNNELASNPDLAAKIADEVAKFKPSGKSRNSNPEDEKRKLEFRELNFNTNYRVFTLQNPFANSKISYYHKSIGGYHGAKLKKYQELIDFYLNPEYRIIYSIISDTITTNDQKLTLLQHSIPVLSMLNAKYIITHPDYAPIVNSNAFGNCWFVNNLEVVDSLNHEMLALGKVNLRNTAILNKREFKLNETFLPDSNASIVQTGFLPNHFTYKSKASTKQFAVFSEIYYADGWNAYIDGVKTDYYRANYLLRAMVVPAGEHTIEFKFEPKSYQVGEGISTASSILLLILVLGILGWEIRKYLKNNSI